MGPMDGRLIMRLDSLIGLGLILSLSKDGAKIFSFSATC